MSETPSKYLALAQKAQRDTASQRQYHESRRAQAARLIEQAHSALQPFHGLTCQPWGYGADAVTVAVQWPGIAVRVRKYPDERYVQLDIRYDPHRDRITIAVQKCFDRCRPATHRIEWTDSTSDYRDTGRDLDAALSHLAGWIGEHLSEEPAHD